MTTLDITPTYSSDTLLNASDLDSVVTPIETNFNVTKLDEDNIDLDKISNSFSADDFNQLVQQASSTGADAVLNDVSADVASSFISPGFQQIINEVTLSEPTTTSENRVVLSDGNQGTFDSQSLVYGITAPAPSNLTVTTQTLNPGFYICSINGTITGEESGGNGGSATIVGQLDLEGGPFSSGKDTLVTYNETFSTSDPFFLGFFGSQPRPFNNTIFLNITSETTLTLKLRLTSAAPNTGDQTKFEAPPPGFSVAEYGCAITVSEVELKFTRIRDAIT